MSSEITAAAAITPVTCWPKPLYLRWRYGLHSALILP